jgi:hypothetical protein
MPDNSNRQNEDPTSSVPRYEFLEIKRELERFRKENSEAKLADELRIANVDKKVDDNVKDINSRLEDKYMTSRQVNDQFKIELSDYKFIKIILGVIGVGVVGLIFAVVQQWLINTGS